MGHATAGMLASLHDSHTSFLDPKAFQESRQQILGRPGFTGIGVVIISRKDSASAAVYPAQPDSRSAAASSPYLASGR